MEDSLSCLGAAAAAAGSKAAAAGKALFSDNSPETASSVTSCQSTETGCDSCLGAAAAAGSKAMFSDNSPKTPLSSVTSQRTETGCDSCSEQQVNKYSDLFPPNLNQFVQL